MAPRRAEFLLHIRFDQNLPKFVLKKVAMSDSEYKAPKENAHRMSVEISQYLANLYMTQNFTLFSVDNENN